MACNNFRNIYKNTFINRCHEVDSKQQLYLRQALQHRAVNINKPWMHEACRK